MTSSWQRAVLALALAVHLVFVWSIVAQPLDPGVPPTTRRFLTARLSYDSANWPGPGADFFAAYHSGIQARRGASPYDLEEVPRTTPYFFRFIYTYSALSSLLVGRAVTVVPPHAAYLLWVAIVELSLAAWLCFLWQSGISEPARTASLAVLLVNQPYFLELHMGQCTFLAVVLTLFSAVILQKKAGRRALPASLLLGAATLLKTFPFVVAPSFLRSRKGWIPASASVIVLAGSLLAATFIADPEHRVASGFVDAAGGPHPGAFSLMQAGFVAVLAIAGVWLPKLWPALPTLLLALGVGAVVAWSLWRRLDPVPSAALGVLAFILSFNHAWEHHYSAAILAGTALLLPGDGAISESRRPVVLLLLAWLALPTLYAFMPEPWTAGAWIAMSLWKALPLAGLVTVATRPT